MTRLHTKRKMYAVWPFQTGEVLQRDSTALTGALIE